MTDQPEKVPHILVEARGRIGRLINVVAMLETKLDLILGSVPETVRNDKTIHSNSGSLVLAFEQYAAIPELCDRLERCLSRLQPLSE